MATTMEARELNDAELITGARKGDSEAYGELYRRHVDSARAAARALTRSHSDADDLTSEAFARVLRALQRGGGPEVSFRPYLVTAVRNVFYDKVRRNREEPSPDMSDEVNVALLDAASSQEDGAFAAAAFATLPERWQLVLWHTEVEGRSVAEVAPLLGLVPNAVAALAYRAREGLRQAYLQAHLRDQHVAECRECSASLGAYVRDGLSARDRRRIDAHLDGCDSCSALVAELTDTNKTLRAALIPALIGVSSAAYLSGLGGHSLLTSFTQLPKKQQATAGAAAAAVLVMLALVAGAFRGDDKPARNAAETVVTDAADGGGGAGGDGSSNSRPPVTVPPPTITTAPPTVSTVPVTAAPLPTFPIIPITPATPTTARPTQNTRPPVVTAPVTTPLATAPPATAPPATAPPATTPPATTPPATTPPTPTTSTLPPPPPSLEAVAVQRSAALANGEVKIEITVTNTGTTAAEGIRLNVPVPAGATFARSQVVSSPPMVFVVAVGAGWGCTGNVTCTLATLAPGNSTVVLLTFEISPSAPSSITLSPAIAEPVGAIVSATPITVPVGTVAGLLAAQTERGAVVAIGNSVTTCSDLDVDCGNARNGSGSRLNHNDFAMQYVNTAGGVFNSSSASLSLTGTASRAFLLWGGDVVQGAPAAVDPSARNTVKFTTPGGSSTVIAEQLQNNSGDTYFAYAEVTPLIAGSGSYSVADIQTALGTASFGGWSLVVIEHNAALPERLLMVAAPTAVISGSSPPTTFSVDLVDPMVNATGRLVVAGFEGERTLTGDSVSLSGFSVGNAFSGIIPGTRNPAYQNTLGTDVMIAAASGMNGAQLTFTASSTNDRIMVGMVAIALDL